MEILPQNFSWIGLVSMDLGNKQTNGRTRSLCYFCFKIELNIRFILRMRMTVSSLSIFMCGPSMCGFRSCKFVGPLNDSMKSIISNVLYCSTWHKIIEIISAKWWFMARSLFKPFFAFPGKIWNSAFNQPKCLSKHIKNPKSLHPPLSRGHYKI